MAREEIIEKLDDFLNNRKTALLDEESHVVYMMVEIRKVLDHEDNNKYPLLRFYCDWTVHTEKDKITDEMKTIMEEIFIDVKSQIENPAMVEAMSPIMKFTYMENLKAEIQQFLEEHRMNTDLLNDDNWIQFISLLVAILANQPINNPTQDITLFSFLPSAPGCVQGIVVFKEPINEKPHYKFGNAY